MDSGVSYHSENLHNTDTTEGSIENGEEHFYGTPGSKRIQSNQKHFKCDECSRHCLTAVRI